jgi:glycosyltransferase involved in cell wall biosynthesis
MSLDVLDPSQALRFALVAAIGRAPRSPPSSQPGRRRRRHRAEGARQPPRAALIIPPPAAELVNVLYFADTRFPIERANGVQTMATCHALAGRGHEVRLVVRPDTAVPRRDPFAFYGLDPEPRLRVEIIAAGGGPHARRVRFLLEAARRAAATSGVVYTRDLGLASFLMQFPRRRRPRLVYESHGVASVVSQELPRLLGKTELAPSPAKIARLDRRDRRVWQRAPAYVTITQGLADDLTERYGPRDHLFVVPDGAPEPTDASRSADTLVKAGLDPGQGVAPALVVGYAGHLYPWKGVDILVRALADLPSVRAVIIGGHPHERDFARVRALVDELGLQHRVELTGQVAPAAVRPLLARASILVLPNTASATSDRYTSPLKLFEYLSLGRAIVASDLPALREVLSDGVTALLVPPGRPDALAQAIQRLAEQPALMRALAQRAAELAPRFTWRARAERLEAALAAAS